MSVHQDHAIDALRSLKRDGGVPTYAWLKSQFGRRQISEMVYRSLDRGRAILQTVDQLDQYLFSYAPMVASQWHFALQHISLGPSGSDRRIIDYGCGQGLAGLLLNDGLGPNLYSNVTLVLAIEPSSVALARAAAVYASLAPKAAIIPINKTFDALGPNDLNAGQGPTIHLLSNVLDLDGYDHVALLRRGLTPGAHTIIAIGHDRTQHGYSQGLQRVKDAVESNAICAGVTVHASGLEQLIVTIETSPQFYGYAS